MEKLNKTLKLLLDSPTKRYGGMSIQWYEGVKCFLELNSKHLF